MVCLGRVERSGGCTVETEHSVDVMKYQQQNAESGGEQPPPVQPAVRACCESDADHWTASQNRRHG